MTEYNKEAVLQMALSGQHKAALPMLLKLQKSPDVLTTTAMCYLGVGQTKKALNTVKKSLKLNKSAISYLVLSDVYKRAGNMAKAERYITKAYSMDSKNAAITASYARILAERGDTAAAIKMIERAKRLDPSKSLECATLRATIDKTNNYSHHFRVLEKEFSEGLPVRQLIPSAFSLGKCYDAVGDYDQAFKYYEIGNNYKHAELITNNQEHQPERHRAYCEAIKKELPFSANGNESKDPIFIVGMPRSGTTLVEQIITARDVKAGGEMPYLTELANKIDYDDINCANLGKQYLDKTGLRGGRFTDKLPNNFHFIGLIRSIFPYAKIIHVKRNPYDTCLSAYFANFSALNWTNDLQHLASYYNDYLDIIEHWRGNVDFYEVEYEELIKNQEAETRGLLEYCELPFHEDHLHPEKNKSKVTTASFTQVRQKVNSGSINKHESYSQYLKELYKEINKSSPFKKRHFRDIEAAMLIDFDQTKE